MKLLSLLTVLSMMTLVSFKLKDHPQKVTDYFSAQGPVEFNKTMYHLSWSAHPAGNYYKQEYLAANEKSASFNTMIMLEAVVGEIPLQNAVKAKINELEQRKKTDPVTNYQIIENQKTGEYLLDFVISQPGRDKASIVEWNAYRYTTLSDKSGKKGILLFAYSRRSYGDNIPNFLKALKKERLNDINAISGYKIPVVTIKSE